MSQTLAELKEILVALGINGADPGPDDNLVDIGFDSLKTMDLVLEIEGRFGIELSDTDLQPENLQTVRSVVEMIDRCRSRNRSGG